jgi:hypothetical protein
MADLETIKGKVLINADRYEDLIKLEAKVEAVATLLTNEKYMRVNTLLSLLGFYVPKESEEDGEVCSLVDEL